jgi:hypothetical protein
VAGLLGAVEKPPPPHIVENTIAPPTDVAEHRSAPTGTSGALLQIDNASTTTTKKRGFWSKVFRRTGTVKDKPNQPEPPRPPPSPPSKKAGGR